MAEWKKILTETPSTTDLQGGDGTAGQALGTNGSGVFTWIDAGKVPVTANAPTGSDATSFPNGNGSMVIHSGGGVSESDNDLYFLSNDGGGIFKIEMDLENDLTFRITSASGGGGTYHLIGAGATGDQSGSAAGVWKAAGVLDFSVSYGYAEGTSITAITEGTMVANGISGLTGITANITTGPSTAEEFDNDSDITYSGVAKDAAVDFTVTAKVDGQDYTKNTSDIRFVNNWYNGATAVSGTMTSTDIKSLSNIDLRTNTSTPIGWIDATIGVTTSDYHCWAYAADKVSLSGDQGWWMCIGVTSGTLEGVDKAVSVGLDASGDVNTKVTLAAFENENGFQEDYYVYKTHMLMPENGLAYTFQNASLRNYIFSGNTSQTAASAWTSDEIQGGSNATLDTSYATNDCAQGDSLVFPDNANGTIAVTTFHRNIYFAVPARLDHSEALNFYDPVNLNAPFAMTKVSGTVSVTNKFGYIEPYHVYVSTEEIWASGATNANKFYTTNL